MTNRVWRGVRMRETAAGADPDAPARPLTASWDDRAAAALAALTPGAGRTSLPAAAEAWVRPIAARARLAGEPALADGLHHLLLARRAAPTAPLWDGGAGPPGFVLNLAAFHDPELGLDIAGLDAAARLAATALRLLDSGAAGYAIALSDLDGLLAALGIDYASTAARAVATNLAALVRGAASVALAGTQPDLLSRLPGWPIPAASPLPALDAAAASTRAEAMQGSASLPCTAILPPGPADALLGVETGGIAPAYGAVGWNGALTRAAQARLAHLGLSPEAALARLLSGEALLAPVPLAAHQAMHDAVAPFMAAMPPRPAALPGAPQPVPRRRELPARRRGFTQKASLGGHRIFLRTGEYEDGTLGEIHISLPREAAPVRGLVHGLAAAMTIGLQHGVPLADYVDALALVRFAPAGPVEGDPAITYATSVLDYVVRSLAHAYLGHSVPEPMPEVTLPPPPLLPLDLPETPRPRRLRLVANR